MYNEEKMEINIEKERTMAAVCISSKFTDSKRAKEAGVLCVLKETDFLWQTHIRMETNV